MNWLLVIVLSIIAGFTIWGYRKGVILMFLSFGTVVLSVVITGIVGPSVGNSLCKNQEIMDTVSDAVNENMGIEKCLNDLLEQKVGKYTGETEQKKLNQKEREQAMSVLELPETIKNNVVQGVMQEVSEVGKVTVKKFSTYICDEIAKIIIKGIVYIVVFLLVKIVLKVVVSVFKVIDRLPVIEETSELLGGAVGAATGFIIVWVGFMFLLAFSGTALGMQCYEYINDSAILSFLYNNNLLLKWILSSFSA